MPSLRKRVSSYLRQLSFHNEPRDKRNNVNENAFITQYLEGNIKLREGPSINYGKIPTDLPNYELGKYEWGPSSIVGSYTGPKGGLTTVKRTEKHLSVPDDDIDFIDNPDVEPSDKSIENLDPNSQVNDSLLPLCWNQKSDCCYGISDSLYDRNQVTKHKNGDPIADCFGIIARNDSAILAVADGVNWGEKASIAAKSAVHGSLHYLNKTIFNDTKLFESLTNKTDDVDLSRDSLNHGEISSLVNNTREVFVCLLRAFNCAHDLILENKGMLTTLTVAVVLPLKQRSNELKTTQESQFVCCVCNVGDTLAYVYSQTSGIRELTKGSHDVNCNRDLRDALGALGPVDGINPELSNLTLSITTLSKGDMVIIASDGLTDNFDPNVCKFTINSTKADVPKARTEQKVSVAKQTAQKPPVKPPRKNKNRGSISSANQSERSNSSSEKEVKMSVQSGSLKKSEVEFDNPLIAHFMRENSLEDPTRTKNDAKDSKTTQPRGGHNQTAQAFRLTKAKTSLELRSYHQTHKYHILRNEDGLPFVSPIQRYELQLLLMEDILKNGISGRDKPIITAKRLCENLVSFTMSITSAKRRTLEDPDLYFDNRNGVLVEVSNQEKKLRRKRAMDKVQSLPGKLDHVTVVAYNAGNVF